MLNLKRLSSTGNFALLSFCLAAIVLSGCGLESSGPTANTYVEVPDSDWTQLSESGAELKSWTSKSYELSDAPKLKYKQIVFQPFLEHEQQSKKIQNLHLDKLLKQVDGAAELTLLQDGRVLASGGGVPLNFQPRPISDLVILNPRSMTTTRLAGLQIPRVNHSVVQLKDGRVIFIGGETTKKFADDLSDDLTNTVEQLDLPTGKTTIIGRLSMARKEVLAEVVGDRDVLVVGGWNQRQFARDERWWPGAEIFKVPPI